MPKVPKIGNLHIFAISLDMGDEVALFLADKYESFLQNASIILGVCKQACQSTRNNNLAISLQYLEENGKNEVGFLLADKH